MGYLTNSNGITVRQLHDWLNDFILAHGDQGTVWAGNSYGRSNEVVTLWQLNESDILVEIRQKEKQLTDAKTELLTRMLAAITVDLAIKKQAVAAIAYDEHIPTHRLGTVRRLLDEAITALDYTIDRMNEGI